MDPRVHSFILKGYNRQKEYLFSLSFMMCQFTSPVAACRSAIQIVKSKKTRVSGLPAGTLLGGWAERNEGEGHKGISSFNFPIKEIAYSNIVYMDKEFEFE